MKKNKLKIAIAGGKTGGHLFPGIAVAQQFEKTDIDFIFIGSKGGLEEKILPQKGYDLNFITIGGLKGKNLLQTIKNLCLIPIAFFQSVKILTKNKVDAVISLGGYAAGPASLAGKILGKKIFILEQNSIPGITNRLVGKFADKIFISYKKSETFFDKPKTVLTGNPVRNEVLNAKPLEIETKKRILAVFGGSQGATSLNETIFELFKQNSELSNEFFVIHQTGKKDFQKAQDFYKNNNIENITSDFFEKPGEIYKRADEIVCRAGATTIAELVALEKFAIYLPFPFASDNHQFFNAKFIEENGGGRVIKDKQNAKEQAKELKEILKEKKSFEKRNLDFMTGTNVAKTIVDKIKVILEKK